MLFSLNSSSYGKLAAQLGALAIQDLIAVAGERLSDPSLRHPANVAVDEFSALERGDHGRFVGERRQQVARAAIARGEGGLPRIGRGDDHRNPREPGRAHDVDSAQHHRGRIAGIEKKACRCGAGFQSRRRHSVHRAGTRTAQDNDAEEAERKQPRCLRIGPGE